MSSSPRESMRPWGLAYIVVATLSACGRGPGDHVPPIVPPSPPPTPPAPATHSVGGAVVGLDGSLVLRNNGGDDLTLAADGPFTFATELANGNRYEVSVFATPPDQACTIANGGGLIAGADVDDVLVTCADLPTNVAAGRLDPTFGSEGKITTDFSGAPTAVTVTSKPTWRTLQSAAASSLGAPQMLVHFLQAQPGEFPAGTYDVIDIAQQYGGVLQRTHSWGGDYAESYADDTGTFWTYASRRFNNFDGSRPGIGAGVTFIQRFRKDADDASLTFTVSSALLHADRGLGLGMTGGALAGFQADGSLLTFDTAWSETLQFNQRAELGTQAGGAWEALEVSGPMTYQMTLDDEQVKQVDFDRYTGAFDVSSVKVGGEFTVMLRAEVWAETGPAEIPASAEAFFRDPLGGSGGVTIDAAGLTALDEPSVDPEPRDRAAAQAVQADGRIVVVGQAYVDGDYDFALARYEPNGALDPSFGGEGKITIDPSDRLDAANAVAIQPDGRIVVAGAAQASGSTDFALVRYNADGTLDSGFGQAGVFTFDIEGRHDEALAIAVRSDGKILLAGRTWNGNDWDFALARFDPSGAPDTTFGAGGVVITDFAGASDSAEALALQDDGAIVVAGYTDSGSAAFNDLALARYLPSGALDASFGDAGRVVTDVSGASDYAHALALQEDGSVVVAGSAYNGTHNDLLVARYTSTGQVDGSFGSGGRTTIDCAADHDAGRALAIQSDGKILISGYARNGGQYDFAIVRLQSDGSPDDEFGEQGVTLIDFEGNDDRGAALSIQNAGRAIAIGYALTATGDDFALAGVTL